MVPQDGPIAVMSRMVLLTGLVVLNVALLMVLPLLVVELDRHALTAEGAVHAGVVTLLVVLGEHAACLGGLEAGCRFEESMEGAEVEEVGVRFGASRGWRCLVAAVEVR